MIDAQKEEEEINENYYTDEEEETLKKKPEEEYSNYNDAAIKSIQIHLNENQDEIFYKYSWRNKGVAYYKCLSGKCKGRAKASIFIDDTNKICKLSQLSVIKYSFSSKIVKGLIG